MDLTISKIAALVLAVAYVIAAGVAESLSFAATVAVGVLLPLTCIWFAEPMGSWTGVWRRYSPISPSPAWLVATMGWVLLVGIPLFVLIEALNKGR
jgi:uncharacterized membrane protein YoaT (DUF817 family)